MIDCLHLEILQCSCSCGQRWTHSYPLAAGSDGTLGGRPDPQMQLKLTHRTMTVHHRQFNGCFRCVSLQLSEGWTKPLVESFQAQPSEARAAVAPKPSATDLLT